jgi:hypothetical protein
MANSRPAARIAFVLSADQSAIIHLNVTVQKIAPHPSGWRVLSVASGCGFLVTVPPGLLVAVGDWLTLEYPKGKAAQRGPMDVRILDYIEDSYRTLDWYVGEIEKRPYRWGFDYLPHDERTRIFQTGKNTAELLS